jgi:hypothetical protein
MEMQRFMSMFTTWTNLWFGCWSEFGNHYSECPSIDDFIDEDWVYPALDKLVNYLQNAPVVATTSRLAIPWAKGHGDGRSSVSYRSDGVWLWFDDLDYYVLEHNVRLPNAFVKHIESNNFRPPVQVDFDPQKLQWPPIK